ncbi:MAG: cytochrome c3 family protein [Desulfovibrionales bacterium]
MKKLVISLISGALLCAFVIPSLYAVDVPADMVLKAPEGVEMKQSPVDFSHTTHADLECTACHHEWDGESEVQSCSAEGCHDIFEAKSPKDKRDPRFFYNAWHDRKSEISCVGCHAALKKAGEATGPIGCADCHPK